MAHIALDKSNDAADSSKVYIETMVNKVQDYAQNAAIGSTSNTQQMLYNVEFWDQLDPLQGYIRVIWKVQLKEETKDKFAQNKDYFLTRRKRKFWCSLKNHLKQALILLPKATKSSPTLV